MLNNYRFREQRFRAWNKETKRMVYSFSSKIGFIFCGDGAAIVEVDDNGEFLNEHFGDDTNCVIMSWTGARDKSNKDIYEGDIVFVKRRVGRQFLPHVGIVNAKDFQYIVDSGKYKFPFEYTDSETEVIGNIFENTDEEMAKKAEELISKFSKKI